MLVLQNHPHYGDRCELAVQDDGLDLEIKIGGVSMRLVKLISCSHGGIEKVYADETQLKEVVLLKE